MFPPNWRRPCAWQCCCLWGREWDKAKLTAKRCAFNQKFYRLASCLRKLVNARKVISIFNALTSRKWSARGKRDGELYTRSPSIHSLVLALFLCLPSCTSFGCGFRVPCLRLGAFRFVISVLKITLRRAVQLRCGSEREGESKRDTEKREWEREINWRSL